MDGLCQRFDALCRDPMLFSEERGGIGVYKEKRLHRMLKLAVSDNTLDHEVKVGTRVADVLCNGEITEVQTGSLRPLASKLEYYLENTDHRVCVVMPIIAKKTIIRLSADTGEVLRKRFSPTKKGYADALFGLFYLGQIFPNDRLTIKILLIEAEEYRYSERVRYRRSGAYDSELFPVGVMDSREVRQHKDVMALLPQVDTEITAKEFSKLTGLKERDASMLLSFLMGAGSVTRRKEGKKFLYTFMCP